MILEEWAKQASKVAQHLYAQKMPNCPMCGFNPEEFLRELNELSKSLEDAGQAPKRGGRSGKATS